MKTTAKNEALKILAKKDLSSKSLKEKLLNKGFSPEEVDEEIENLKNKKILNDDKLKERMKDVLLEKGKGFFYLKYHLNQEGLGEDFQLSLEDEAVHALKVIKSKKIKKSDLKDSKKKIKMMLFLSRRGFRQEAISKAMAIFSGKA
ncbi:MAG: RecX family transcriptional regulator [Acidobacteria bacterium]|nr:RecX family transcriptional regulator [Acidobacteriota bacterium]